MPPNKKRYVVNFPAHLADCEFNYYRLQRLMPGWKHEPATSAAASRQWAYIIGRKAHSEMALLFSVIDSARYTTTLRLEIHSHRQRYASWRHYFKAICQTETAPKTVNGFSPAAPKQHFSLSRSQQGVTMKASGGLGAYCLDVRLYHDATVAEVIACAGQRQFKARHEYPNQNMYQTDEKAQLNRFLGELLERCLSYGRVLDELLFDCDGPFSTSVSSKFAADASTPVSENGQQREE